MSDLDHLGQWEQFLWLQGIPMDPEMGNAISLVCMSEDIKHYNYEDDPSNTSRAMGSI
jgi:hypothetical protein